MHTFSRNRGDTRIARAFEKSTRRRYKFSFDKVNARLLNNVYSYKYRAIRYVIQINLLSQLFHPCKVLAKFNF